MRRNLIKIVLAYTLFVFSCGTQKPVLNVLIWVDYLSERLVTQFEKEHGVLVNVDTYDSSEQMFLKYRLRPGVYDILVPSEYMAERMFHMGLLTRLPKEDVPNLRHVDPAYVMLWFDPHMEYALPYFISELGLLYNKDFIPPPTGWDALFNSHYSGRILMIDGMREAFGAALLSLEKSVNSRDKEVLKLARDRLIQQKPHVLAYGVDDLPVIMVRQEAWLSLAWTGDAYIAMRENPALDFYLPEQGRFVYSMDCIVIPKDAPHPDLAAQFIDFLYETNNNLENALHVGYQSPHKEVHKFLMEEDDLAGRLYPSYQELEIAQVFYDLPAELQELYVEYWTEIIESP